MMWALTDSKTACSLKSMFLILQPVLNFTRKVLIFLSYNFQGISLNFLLNNLQHFAKINSHKLGRKSYVEVPISFIEIWKSHDDLMFPCICLFVRLAWGNDRQVHSARHLYFIFPCIFSSKLEDNPVIEIRTFPKLSLSSSSSVSSFTDLIRQDNAKDLIFVEGNNPSLLSSNGTPQT